MGIEREREGESWKGPGKKGEQEGKLSPGWTGPGTLLQKIKGSAWPGAGGCARRGAHGVLLSPDSVQNSCEFQVYAIVGKESYQVFDILFGSLSHYLGRRTER